MHPTSHKKIAPICRRPYCVFCLHSLQCLPDGAIREQPAQENGFFFAFFLYFVVFDDIDRRVLALSLNILSAADSLQDWQVLLPRISLPPSVNVAEEHRTQKTRPQEIHSCFLKTFENRVEHSEHDRRLGKAISPFQTAQEVSAAGTDN